jgi:putative peptidoglycan lipid II flippase
MTADPQTESGSPAKKNTSVTASAFKVMLGGMFTLLAGLASQIVVASIFGAGAEMDAFLTAWAVPYYFQLVLTSWMPFVIVPAFVQQQESNSEDTAWALVGTFTWLTVGILTLLSLIVVFIAPTIINLVAPGLSPYKADLSTKMLYILVFTVPLSGLNILSTGIQNTRGRFFWPSIAPAIGSISNLLAVMLLHQRIGPVALAWGNLASVALSALVPVVPMLRHGWKRLVPLKDQMIRELVHLMLPFILFGVLTSSVSLFERFFASGLPDGDLSYLGYAGKISSILVIAVALGIASAIFPEMARAYVQNGERGLVEQAEYGLRLTLAVALPALGIMAAAAVPLITILYERGAFDHSDTLSVSRIVLIVLIGDVLFRMLNNVINRTLFVIKDTRTGPMISAASTILYVFLAKVLANAFGYVGLAVASALLASLNFLGIGTALYGKLRFFNLGKLFKDFLLYLAASLAASLSAWLISNALASTHVLVQLIAIFGVSGPLYLGILYLIDKDMAVAVLEMAGIRQIVNGIRGRFQDAATRV